MARKCLPSLYLSSIFSRRTSSDEISAIPLKPASWILRINPALRLPFTQRLGRVYRIVIQADVFFVGVEFSVVKPVIRKLGTAIGQIFPTKHPELQHFGGSEFRPEIGVKIFTFVFNQRVTVFLLHSVINVDNFHRRFNSISWVGWGCMEYSMSLTAFEDTRLNEDIIDCLKLVGLAEKLSQMFDDANSQTTECSFKQLVCVRYGR